MPLFLLNKKFSHRRDGVSPPNAIAAAEVGLSFFDWMKGGFPAMIVLLLVAIAILYLLFRPELKGTFEMNSEQVDWDKGKDDAWRPVFEYRLYCRFNRF
ncbi:anion permease [Klebsiella pneumoniae]|uniref:anion permease n=2 Tax=Klebsiella pneumoniae TaxID=573 RepID=UPI000E2C3C2C|nr:anion permease [Klebsiella pneumoniae]MEC4397488.1 anion permease [Klebsiella pneumoniae]SYB83946.1 di-and tricarboxylate transporter [Klebsiella pneumoniae]